MEYGDTVSATLKLLSSQRMGAPVFANDGWANCHLIHYKPFGYSTRAALRNCCIGKRDLNFRHPQVDKMWMKVTLIKVRDIDNDYIQIILGQGCE